MFRMLMARFESILGYSLRGIEKQWVSMAPRVGRIWALGISGRLCNLAFRGRYRKYWISLSVFHHRVSCEKVDIRESVCFQHRLQVPAIKAMMEDNVSFPSDESIQLPGVPEGPSVQFAGKVKLQMATCTSSVS